MARAIVELQRVQIPGYDLGNLVGVGNNGAVWEGSQNTLVKVARVPGEAVFAQEIALFTMLDGRVVPKLVASGMAGNHAYMVVQRPAGRSLAHGLERGVASLDVIAPLARAIDELHRAGIIHGDLKPENIYVAREPAVTCALVDLGNARRPGAPPIEGLPFARERGGTPHYLAPEQVPGDNRPLNFATDVYAFGAICFEILCGRPPFIGTVAQVKQGHAMDRPPRPSSIANVDPRYDAPILRCLAKDVGSRFASPRAAVEILARIIAGGSGSSPGIPTPRATESADESAPVERPAHPAPGTAYGGRRVAPPAEDRSGPSGPSRPRAGSQIGEDDEARPFAREEIYPAGRSRSPSQVGEEPKPRRAGSVGDFARDEVFSSGPRSARAASPSPDLAGRRAASPSPELAGRGRAAEPRSRAGMPVPQARAASPTPEAAGSTGAGAARPASIVRSARSVGDEPQAPRDSSAVSRTPVRGDDARASDVSKTPFGRSPIRESARDDDPWAPRTPIRDSRDDDPWAGRSPRQVPDGAPAASSPAALHDDDPWAPRPPRDIDAPRPPSGRDAPGTPRPDDHAGSRRDDSGRAAVPVRDEASGRTGPKVIRDDASGPRRQRTPEDRIRDLIARASQASAERAAHGMPAPVRARGVPTGTGPNPRAPTEGELEVPPDIVPATPRGYAALRDMPTSRLPRADLQREDPAIAAPSTDDFADRPTAELLPGRFPIIDDVAPPSALDDGVMTPAELLGGSDDDDDPVVTSAPSARRPATDPLRSAAGVAGAVEEPPPTSERPTGPLGQRARPPASTETPSPSERPTGPLGQRARQLASTATPREPALRTTAEMPAAAPPAPREWARQTAEMTAAAPPAPAEWGDPPVGSVGLAEDGGRSAPADVARSERPTERALQRNPAGATEPVRSERPTGRLISATERLRLANAAEAPRSDAAPAGPPPPDAAALRAPSQNEYDDIEVAPASGDDDDFGAEGGTAWAASVDSGPATVVAGPTTTGGAKPPDAGATTVAYATSARTTDPGGGPAASATSSRTTDGGGPATVAYDRAPGEAAATVVYSEGPAHEAAATIPTGLDDESGSARGRAARAAKVPFPERSTTVPEAERASLPTQPGPLFRADRSAPPTHSAPLFDRERAAVPTLPVPTLQSKADDDAAAARRLMLGPTHAERTADLVTERFPTSPSQIDDTAEKPRRPVESAVTEMATERFPPLDLGTAALVESQHFALASDHRPTMDFVAADPPIEGFEISSDKRPTQDMPGDEQPVDPARSELDALFDSDTAWSGAPMEVEPALPSREELSNRVARTSPSKPPPPRASGQQPAVTPDERPEPPAPAAALPSATELSNRVARTAPTKPPPGSKSGRFNTPSTPPESVVPGDGSSDRPEASSPGRRSAPEAGPATVDLGATFGLVESERSAADPRVMTMRGVGAPADDAAAAIGLDPVSLATSDAASTMSIEASLAGDASSTMSIEASLAGDAASTMSIEASLAGDAASTMSIEASLAGDASSTMSIETSASPNDAPTLDPQASLGPTPAGDVHDAATLDVAADDDDEAEIEITEGSADAAETMALDPATIEAITATAGSPDRATTSGGDGDDDAEVLLTPAMRTKAPAHETRTKTPTGVPATGRPPAAPAVVTNAAPAVSRTVTPTGAAPAVSRTVTPTGAAPAPARAGERPRTPTMPGAGGRAQTPTASPADARKTPTDPPSTVLRAPAAPTTPPLRNLTPSPGVPIVIDESGPKPNPSSPRTEKADPPSGPHLLRADKSPTDPPSGPHLLRTDKSPTDPPSGPHILRTDKSPTDPPNTIARAGRPTTPPTEEAMRARWVSSTPATTPDSRSESARALASTNPPVVADDKPRWTPTTPTTQPDSRPDVVRGLASMTPESPEGGEPRRARRPSAHVISRGANPGDSAQLAAAVQAVQEDPASAPMLPPVSFDRTALLAIRGTTRTAIELLVTDDAVAVREADPIIYAFPARDPAAGVRAAIRIAQRLPTAFGVVHCARVAITERGGELELDGEAIANPVWALDGRPERVAMTVAAAEEVDAHLVRTVPTQNGERLVPGELVGDELPEVNTVGRDDTIAALHEIAIAVTGAGRPVVRVIEGAAGTGKTRVLRELEGALAASGLGVWWCAPDAPIHPIVTVVARAVAIDPRQVLDASPEQLGAPLWAALQVILETDQAPRALAPSRSLAIATVALGHAIRDAARRSPIAILVDDAHRVEPLLLDALEIALAHGAPIFAAISSIPGGLDHRPLASSGARVTLAPLDEEGATRLALDLLQPGGETDAWPPELVRELVQRSGGNPRALFELALELRSTGAFRRMRTTRSWSVAPSALEPLRAGRTGSGLAAIAARSIARLPEDLTRIAHAVALGGGPATACDEALATRVAAELGSATPALAIERLVQLRVLERGGKKLRFHLAQVRDRLLAAALADERLLAHAAFVVAIDQPFRRPPSVPRDDADDDAFGGTTERHPARPATEDGLFDAPTTQRVSPGGFDGPTNKLRFDSESDAFDRTTNRLAQPGGFDATTNKQIVDVDERAPAGSVEPGAAGGRFAPRADDVEVTTRRRISPDDAFDETTNRVGGPVGERANDPPPPPAALGAASAAVLASGERPAERPSQTAFGAASAGVFGGSAHVGAAPAAAGRETPRYPATAPERTLERDAALARHLRGAGRSDLAAPAFLALAERAIARQRYNEAEESATAALAALDLAAADALTPEQRAARTRARIVRAHARGHLGRVLEALEDAQHARAGCAESGDVRATAHASLEECALLDRASRANEAAAAAIMARTLIIQLAGPIPRADDPEKDNVALRARLAHAEGRALARIGRHRDAKGLLGVAIAFGAKLDTVAGREIELDARLLLAVEHVALGALDAAETELETVFTYAHASNDLPRVAGAHIARALVRAARRDLDAAEADLLAAIELARELRDDALEYRARYHRAELMIWRDRLDDAAASARRAFELCSAAPIPAAGVLLARVAIARADMPALETHLAWIASTFPDDELAAEQRVFRDAGRAVFERVRPQIWDRIVHEAGTIGMPINARLELFLAALAATADAAARADLRRAALALTEDPGWRARLRAAG